MIYRQYGLGREYCVMRILDGVYNMPLLRNIIQYAIGKRYVIDNYTEFFCSRKAGDNSGMVEVFTIDKLGIVTHSEQFNYRDVLYPVDAWRSLFKTNEKIPEDENDVPEEFVKESPSSNDSKCDKDSNTNTNNIINNEDCGDSNNETSDTSTKTENIEKIQEGNNEEAPGDDEDITEGNNENG